MSSLFVIMADQVPAENTNPPTNMLSRMPSPRGKNSLRFRGKDIESFLTEYEHFAAHANLTDDVKCEEVRIYFSRKEKRVLDVLDGYLNRDWSELTEQLRSLYTSSVERKTYQPRDIQRFIARKRKITKLLHFDTYRRQFLVITAGLEARDALSGYDKDDYFWSGIRPTSLRKVLENELRARDYWTDLTSPPPADRVIEVAVKFLDRAIYQPRDVSSRSKWIMKKKKKRSDSSDSESESSDNGASDSSESSAEEEEESEEEDEDVEERRKSTKKKGREEKKRVERRERGTKESKEEEKPPTDHPTQTNIEDLAERFRRLELKLGERGGSQTQPSKTRTAMYCIMCGQSGHGIRECSESKFFIAQGICRMDVNNRVVMGDGSALPRADGEGGAAKQIRNRLSGNIPSTSNLTSASNIEVVAAEADYNDEPNELAVLGSMEFEVLPADRAERVRKNKPYERPETKKGDEKGIPEIPTRPRGPPPNRAYIELPPTILKRAPPAQVLHPSGEDQEMVDGEVPSTSKGKQREMPVIVPALVREPEVPSQKPRERASAPKEAPRFEVANPKGPSDRSKNQPPQYKYATELMNGTNQEQVFQRLLDQPVTVRLGELLGTSYDLGKRFQSATRSQRFPVQQAKMANVEVLKEDMSSEREYEGGEGEKGLTEGSELCEFTVNSGEAGSPSASTEELHEMSYQSMLEEEYRRQYAFPPKEVNLARPHEYRAMVTARLNGRIGEQDYMMLVDSGSELNIMTLHQAQELALPIDDSGSAWTLKGISGHTMGLEGICWNVPVKIGGIEFSHNFFVTRSNLGNKDMVLGQPWLFSHSTRIDYVHEMGVTLQLWENGDRKGRSILINLPLVKAPRNVMPV